MDLRASFAELASFLSYSIPPLSYMKKLTVAQKYQQLKAQTERAGMTVKEVNGKIVVSRKKKPKKK